jgi:hypothetical protein
MLLREQNDALVKTVEVMQDALMVFWFSLPFLFFFSVRLFFDHPKMR